MRSTLLYLILLSSSIKAQSYVSEHFGGSVGVSINMGTHINSIGLNLKGYYTDYFYQVNAGTTINFSTKGFGSRTNFWDSRTSLGLVLLAGKKEQTPNLMLDGLNHQTNYNLGLGYNYLWYLDQAGTSQNSGGFGIHVKSLSLYHENDVFGGQGKDRFRTGHLFAAYRYKEWQFGAGINLWTGETANSRWEKIILEDCPNGFRILEDLPYGKTSHGLLYGSVTRFYPYNQSASLRIGIDSEHVRHAVQNRLIHDLILIPKAIKRTTPHYPRLDSHGCPAFYKEDVRPNLFLLQLSANENWAN